MRNVKSRIAEPEFSERDFITISALSRRDLAYSHHWRNKECDFLQSLWEAAEGRHPNLAYAYFRAVSNGIFLDCIRICNYRESIWRAIKEIKAGMPDEDIIAHLESVLDKMKDGIETLDISEEEFEKRYPSPWSKSKNKQNCKEI